MAGFYPRRHLTLIDALAEYGAGLRGGQIPLEIRLAKTGYASPELASGREGPHAAALRRQLLAHGVERLRFARETSPDQLWRFLSAVALRPQVAAVAGGLAGALQAAEVASVTVDGSEPGVPAATEASESVEELTIPPAPAPTGSVQHGGYYEMFAHPDAAARAVVEAYRAQLRRLVSGARQFESLAQPDEVLRILKFLAQAARSTTGESKEWVFTAVRQVTRGPFVVGLVRRMAASAKELRDRPLITRVLVMVGHEAALAAAEALGEAEDLSARRVLSDTLVALDRVGVPAVDALPEEGAWFLLRNRIALLGETRDALALDEFPRVMRHEDVRLRKETARALAKIEGEEAVDLAIRAFSDADPDVRAAAAVTLGVRDEYYAFHALLHHVEAETDEEVLTEAVRSLGRHGNPAAVPALAEVARSGKGVGLRVEAIRALGAVGRDAISSIKEFQSDRTAEVRQAAAEAVRAAAKRRS